LQTQPSLKRVPAVATVWVGWAVRNRIILQISGGTADENSERTNVEEEEDTRRQERREGKR
jgi:hypothetical protein